MDYVIRQLTSEDEPILWEMLYHGLSSPRKKQLPAREIVHRPEFSRYAEGWGRPGGIGTALLTQLVRANPEQSTISLSFVKGKPVLRLYERFGFKVVEEQPRGIVMHRAV